MTRVGWGQRGYDNTKVSLNSQILSVISTEMW